MVSCAFQVDSPQFRPHPHEYIDYVIRHVPEPRCVLLELPCPSQTLHSVLVVFRAEMALRCVFDNDKDKGDTHYPGGESCARCPVVGYAIGPIEIIAEARRN